MNTKCQIFTPNNYVEKLLDSVNYTSNLYGRKILENSCGDGKILVAVVTRYIKDCKRMNFDETKIKTGLNSDIYGIEIDPVHYNKCINNLNNLLEKFCIGPVNWNVKQTDYLTWNNPVKFDYIIGNPPYITYEELPVSERIALKNNFFSCKKGKFDYCYAFIEKSVDNLLDSGKMAYLIPSSIFKTVFGEKLREILTAHIEKIIDYTNQKVFDNALVKSAILVLQKNKYSKTFLYQDFSNNTQRYIEISKLEKKWVFSQNNKNMNKRFGDYYKVSHVVATLLNDVFVLKNFVLKDGFYVKGEDKIECDLVRETATPRALRYNLNEKIIFPYFYKDGNLAKYSESDFAKNFPEAYKYFFKYKIKLDKRKKDKSAKWFEYGRSQALNGLNCKKLLISTVVTDSIRLYEVSKACIPYAGMYIIPQNADSTLEEAKLILESPGFLQYAMNIGIHISGNSLRITSKDIMDYRY